MFSCQLCFKVLFVGLLKKQILAKTVSLLVALILSIDCARCSKVCLKKTKKIEMEMSSSNKKQKLHFLHRMLNQKKNFFSLTEGCKGGGGGLQQSVRARIPTQRRGGRGVTVQQMMSHAGGRRCVSLLRNWKKQNGIQNDSKLRNSSI